MIKTTMRAAVILYVLVWAAIVIRAWSKLGHEQASVLALAGGGLLIVLWRVWNGLKYMLFGGAVPRVALGQGTLFPTVKAKGD